MNGAVSYDVEVDEPDGDHSQFVDFVAGVHGREDDRHRHLGLARQGRVPEAARLPDPAGALVGDEALHAHDRGAGRRADGEDRCPVLLSWNAKPAAKNYRVQISQRADFQGTVEQVDTDNTSYAPTLLSPTYLRAERSGGASPRRTRTGTSATSARGSSSRCPSSLGTAALTRLKLATKVESGQRPPRDRDGEGERPRARGALVRVFAPGVTPLKAKTNRRPGHQGQEARPGKRLVLRKLRFHAAKTGFLPGRRTIAIRY